MTSQSPSNQVPPADWVPVEHRFAGIDKRTILPSLAVLLLAIVYSVVIPAIDRSVPYNEPTAAGDVIDLGGGRLTFEPAPGWNLADGVRVGESRTSVPNTHLTRLTKGDTSFTVSTGAFRGTPTQLLNQVDKVNSELKDVRGLGSSTKRIKISTASGQVGVMETYTRQDNQGFVATFVIPTTGSGGTTSPVGVVITAVGSAESLTDDAQDIGTMIRSVMFSNSPGATSK